VFSNKKYQCKITKYPEGLENILVSGDVVEYDFENNSLSFMLTDTKTSDNIIKINP
jgi:hypothetical protein